jgi:hypothetical protein
MKFGEYDIINNRNETRRHTTAMADFYTHNAPDFGEDDGVMGPPGTSIADKFRRAALMMSLQAKNFSQDPLHTIAPWTRAAGAVAHELPGAMSRAIGGDARPADRPPPSADMALAGQYVGPNDLIVHNTIPGYIPGQDLQNAIRQDPLAGLLGPMQKPTPKPPVVDPGF